METFSPKGIRELKPGVWLYDFGQNSSAIPKITVRDKKGVIIRIKPAELLDNKGLITTVRIGTPVYFDYTLKGGEAET